MLCFSPGKPPENKKDPSPLPTELNNHNQLKNLHINHLKKWHSPDDVISTVTCSETQLPPLSLGNLPWGLKPTDTPPPPQTPERPVIDSNLTERQRHCLYQLLTQFSTLFSSIPGKTTVVWHVIETPAGQVVCTAHHPVPWKRWKTINKEVTDMLLLDVIKTTISAC